VVPFFYGRFFIFAWCPEFEKFSIDALFGVFHFYDRFAWSPQFKNFFTDAVFDVFSRKSNKEWTRNTAFYNIIFSMKRRHFFVFVIFCNSPLVVDIFYVFLV
jgi:hypothetical protein